MLQPWNEEKPNSFQLLTIEPGAELLQAGAGRGAQAVWQSTDMSHSGPDAWRKCYHCIALGGLEESRCQPLYGSSCVRMSIWYWPPTNTACSWGSHTGLCLCRSTGKSWKWAASAFNGAIELPDGSQVTLYVPQIVHLPDSPATGRNNAVPEAELCLCWLLEAASVGKWAGQCV